MAKSIEDLYQQYAGRAPDPEGLAYWTKDFGDTIDPHEISIFQNAVAEARAQGTEPAAQPALTASQIANTPGMGVTGIGVSPAPVAQPAYFAANPDVAAEYTKYSSTYTPEQFAEKHYNLFGVNEGRAAPTTSANRAQVLFTAEAPTLAPAPAAPNYEQMVRDAYASIGRTGIGAAASNIDQQGFDNWVAALQSGSVKPADLTSTFKSSVADYLVANPTDQYSTYVADYLQETNNPAIAEIQKLYKDVLGREADPSGLGTWYQKFGSQVSDEERAEFERAARPEKYSGTPDSIFTTYKNIYGVEPDDATFTELTNRFGPTFDADEIRELVVNDFSLRDDPRGVVKTLQQQILDQGFTDKWSGEGFGSAEKNAADMARMLATAGITDISQFGKISVPADAAVTPVYGIRKAFDPEYGEYDQQYITGYTDANGKAVDPSLVRAEFDENGTGAYIAPVGTKEVFGNKATGVALDPRYDRAQGNIFSGTFAGKGSTGYGVQFREDGTPVFYTQYGGSTNTLNQIMTDLGPIGQIAFAVATGGLSIPQQIAAQAALSLASGADFKDVAKGIAVNTVLRGLPTSGVIQDGAAFLQTVDSSGVLSNAFTSAASSAAKAALTDQDIGDAILSGAIGGGTAGAIDFVAGNIPGFSDLSMSQQNMVKNAISGVTSGQPLDQVLINTAISAGKDAVRGALADDSSGGGITNRVYDDTITQAGADAFLRAKEAGASDEDAMAASNAATGVVINPIDAGGPNLSTTTTYDPRANTVDTNFGDLEGAIATNAINDATRVQRLDEISNQPRFADAYSQARSLLGPNQTFTWNGKEYSTATAQERPDLSAPKVQPATDESAAETARLAAQNRALGVANAPDQSPAETARLTSLNAGLKSMEKTSFLGQIYKDINNQFRLQGEAANEYLRNNPNSPITQSVSSAFEAAGELSRNMGGAALALDNKPLADVIIKGGERLQGMGQSIGTGPEDTKNWKDTVDLIDKAKGTEKLAVLAGRVMDGTSGLARQVGLELRQEIPALFLGGGLLKPTLIASGLIDTADTGGAAVVDAYDDVIKKGGTHQQGLDAGRKAGAAAAATEAAIQLTLGKLADFGAGKLDNLISKGTTKVAGEGVVEGSQEAGASAAVDLALGNAIDINKALTQGVLGAAVGKGTATATSGVDAAQTDVANQTASTAGSAGATATDLGSVGATVPGAATSTNLGEIGSLTPGGDATVGAQGAISVADAEQTMADLGLNVSGDAAVSLAAKIQEAANSGNDVSFSSDANIVTINDATANTKTTVDANTGTTTVVDANANTTSQTKVDGNTQTTVVADANTNTNTQTVVDTKTNSTTSTTIDANNNTTTQTTITGNTQTTVLTDANTNTQTTVKVNVNTGEVIEVKETEVPKDWTQPVIEAPSVPGTPAATPVIEEDPTKKAAKLKLPQKGSATGGGGAGLPSTIDIGGEGLGSRVTQGKIDPLARVKEAQAELEREVMMNQIDPRLMSVMQQRMDPQQQTKQFDSDIGALAKLLGGNKEAPANEGKYYAYGAEDSIDDILGGRAANYAAGGYVEPLKASGGSMALPLLAKSGGALGKYNGREDFKGGKHVAGDGDGQSDDIPAWLADGEFVFPADVVSALGNGSTKAGTDKLYEMMHGIRDRARSKGPKDLPPPALKSPLDYLKSSKRSTK